MRWGLTVIALGAACLFLPIRSLACSLQACLDNGAEVRGNFVVKIKFSGKPLAGVSVEVARYGAEPDAKPLFSGRTAHDGSVQVSLPPGEYWLNTDLLGVSAGSMCFHVSDHPSSKAMQRVEYGWGDFADSTQRVAGSVIDSQPGKGDTPLMNMVHRTEVPIAYAPMELHDPLTGAVYLTTTDREGRFNFEAIPNGTYVLLVLDAHLLIRLDPSSKRDQLLLESRPADGGSCGGVGIRRTS